MFSDSYFHLHQVRVHLGCQLIKPAKIRFQFEDWALCTKYSRAVMSSPVLKYEMIDNQQIASMLRGKCILQVLIISHLAEFGDLLKSKSTDNERVSQCSGCSVQKWNAGVAARSYCPL